MKKMKKMKKKLFLLMAGFVVCGASLNAQSLDEAVLRAALKISADLPAGVTAAVIHFRSDTETLNDYVINELHGAILRNRKLTPLKPDERQWQSIRGDLRFNEAGEISGESVRSIGRLLGARYLVSGSIERGESGGYEIIFTAFDAGNAELKSRYSGVVNPSDPILASLLGLAPIGASPAAAPAAKGSLEVVAVTAGTLEITGEDVNETVEIPARSKLPVGEFNKGDYLAVMRYEDGKIEKKKVSVKSAKAAQIKFSYRPPERLNTLGASVGTTFAAPAFTATAQGTISPGKGSFFELGMDVGLVSGYSDIKHFSLYPFAHVGLFTPFSDAKLIGGGWYIGIGAGCMIATNTYLYNAGEKISNSIFAADIYTGFIFKSGVTVSYTMRTNFDSASNKIAVGYSYRFKSKKN